MCQLRKSDSLLSRRDRRGHGVHAGDTRGTHGYTRGHTRRKKIHFIMSTVIRSRKILSVPYCIYFLPFTRINVGQIGDIFFIGKIYFRCKILNVRVEHNVHRLLVCNKTDSQALLNIIFLMERHLKVK